MKRIKLTVAYDGTNYCGWQIQPNGNTIESVLDKGIKCVTGEDVHVIGASRTDAGVSALGNVAVFDTESMIPGDRFAYAINQHLPDDVSVVDSCEVSPDFHPRHCNTVKTYEYKIVSSRFPVPQLRNSAWNVPYSLDVDKMRKASEYLVGQHDFKSFACVRTSAETTIRTIFSVEIEKTPFNTKSSHLADSYVYVIRVTGNGFLYNMVRIIAGTLMQVGKGQLQPQDVKEMLDAKDRTAAGQTAPPQGLTLVDIYFEEREM